MKMTNLVQEKVPNKLKRLSLLITEKQLTNLIGKTLDNPNLKNILKNEKK